MHLYTWPVHGSVYSENVFIVSVMCVRVCLAVWKDGLCDSAEASGPPLRDGSEVQLPRLLFTQEQQAHNHTHTHTHTHTLTGANTEISQMELALQMVSDTEQLKYNNW